jgi:hypothetical protein
MKHPECALMAPKVGSSVGMMIVILILVVDLFGPGKFMGSVITRLRPRKMQLLSEYLHPLLMKFTFHTTELLESMKEPSKEKIKY